LRNSILLLLLAAGLLGGCTGLPKGIEPVGNFDLQRYYGKWYEIARLDHRFERDLQQVSAEYSEGEGGFVVVKNRGYNTDDEEWRQAIGKAKFKSDPTTGHLLVSFFGPFYASYVIFELDDYDQVYISGNNRKSLWLLSRTAEISEADKNTFLEKAGALGFDTEDLIWVDQSARAE